MTAMAVFLIGCANEQNSPVEEQEKEAMQPLIINAEFEVDSDVESRISYVENNTETGLRPVWAVGDRIEFFLTNSTNQKRALVGEVTSANGNKATISLQITTKLFDVFASRRPIAYHAVTGSGKVGTAVEGGFLYPHLRLTEPKYFQGGGVWDNPAANYQLIKTNHVVNDRVVSIINDNNNSDYDSYLKPSIIQVASGQMQQSDGNYLKFRNIGSLFAVRITNNTENDLNIYDLKLETKGSNVGWVYELNNEDNRYDPATLDMTDASIKASSYEILSTSNDINKVPFVVPANSENVIYQWFMPVKGASVSDLHLKLLIDNGARYIIDLGGEKKFVPAKRYNIKRTWNGTEFVK